MLRTASALLLLLCLHAGAAELLVNPVRVDLFGDEIDDVRYFSVADQRSLDPAPQGLDAIKAAGKPAHGKQGRHPSLSGLSAPI